MASLRRIRAMPRAFEPVKYLPANSRASSRATTNSPFSDACCCQGSGTGKQPGGYVEITFENVEIGGVHYSVSVEVGEGVGVGYVEVGL